MPIVTITVRRGFSDAQKQAVSEAIHGSLVEEIGIPDEDFNHRILELDAEHWHLPAGRSERFLCVEIRMYLGRTVEMKRALFRSIARKVQGLGIASDDVFVVIDEPPRENWSVAMASMEREAKRS